MILYLVAVNLLPHAHHNPESAIAYALDGILTPGMLASIRRRASLATTSLHPWPRCPSRTTTLPTSPPSSMACEDGAMIERQDQRLLLARMKAALAETQHCLRVVERQIVSRAERLTITDRTKRRQHAGSASSWSNSDERLFQQHVAELALARRGEIDALTCKLDRQETALAEFRTRHRVSAAWR